MSHAELAKKQEADQAEWRHRGVAGVITALNPDTKEITISVRTREGAKPLVIPAASEAVIAAAGSDTEHRGSLTLLGGRVYPLRLEFSKAKQGVDDSKTNKDKPKAIKASIALEWQLPNRPAEVISRRNLSPNRFPEVFVAETPFPPDDRSIGYERGTSVSKAW